MGIEIREHSPGKDVNDFIQAGFEVFRSDPMWVPPLDFEFKERLSPKHNPFFARAEVTLFTAWKDGNLVGPLLGDGRSRVAQALEGRLRLLRFLRHDRRPRGRERPHDRRRALAEIEGHEAHDRPAVALRERRDRLPDRRLRLPAEPHDGALAENTRRSSSRARAAKKRRISSAGSTRPRRRSPIAS